MTTTTQAEAAGVSATPADLDVVRAEATVAIEDMLAWSSDALAGLIGLGSLLTFLDAGGPVAAAAPRIRREVNRTASALAQLPDLVARLHQIAERAHTEASR
jgi:hypothetical protein